MFKYYISFAFHCFTQYYYKYKKVLLITTHSKLKIRFFCALCIKKVRLRKRF